MVVSHHFPSEMDRIIDYFPRPQRGMTLAPRVQVFTQLSCNIVRDNDKYDHTTTSSSVGLTSPPLALALPLEPFGPHPDLLPYLPLPPTEAFTLHQFVTFETNSSDNSDRPDPSNPLSCNEDPAVQAIAARLQTIMAMTVGTLCALSTGWWGHFGERHGRTRVLAAATVGLFLT